MKNLFLILAVSFIATTPAQSQWWGSNETVRGNGDMTSEKRNTCSIINW